MTTTTVPPVDCAGERSATEDPPGSESTLRLALRRGVGLFLAMTVLGLVGLFFVTSAPLELHALVGRVRTPYLVLCVVGVPVSDWLLAGARMWLFAKPLAPRVSYFACVKSCAVGGFMGAATPSQTGGGVAQVYVLTKEGASVSASVSVLLITFLCTVIFYVGASVVAWTYYQRLEVSGWQASAPFGIAVLTFASLSFVLLAAVTFPQRAVSFLQRIAHRVPPTSRASGLVLKCMAVIRDAGDALASVMRRHKARFVLSLVLTTAIFTNKFFSAYLAARALGLEPPLGHLMATQMFLHIVLYFFPTPGGSGGAELGLSVLMTDLIPAASMPAFAVLWRTATVYLSVAVGGVLLARYLRIEQSRAIRSSPV